MKCRNCNENIRLEKADQVYHTYRTDLMWVHDNGVDFCALLDNSNYDVAEPKPESEIVTTLLSLYGH